jgi:hypothetical protein
LALAYDAILTIRESTMKKSPSVFPARLLQSVAAAVVLLVPLAAAHAQSMEYRRGYDEGYRAGMDAARGGNMGGPGMEPGGGGRRIIIEDAAYGDRDGACDARPAVQAMVERQREPLVRADNRLCGDPAPRRGKTLEITYRCGNGRMLRTAIREDTQAVLSCRG